MAFLRSMLDNFQYYDKPEGQDPIGKIMGLTKIAIVGAPMIAIYDACLYSRCTNAAQFFNTAGFWVVPLTGMCVSFSTVTYTMCKLRGKDDKLNYVFGVCAAGGVLHAWAKNPLISGWGTALMMLYALLKKNQIENGEHKNVLLPAELAPKEYLKWRNLDYRNYTSAPKWPHVKDYY